MCPTPTPKIIVHVLEDDIFQIDNRVKILRKVLPTNADIFEYSSGNEFAGNPRLAAEALAKDATHIVVTDYSMPRGDAPLVCDAIEAMIRVGLAPEQIKFIGLSTNLDRHLKMLELRNQGVNSVAWSKISQDLINKDDEDVDLPAVLRRILNSTPQSSS